MRLDETMVTMGKNDKEMLAPGCLVRGNQALKQSDAFVLAISALEHML